MMSVLLVIMLFGINPLIQEMVNKVSSDTILANVQRFQDFVTRYATHDSCFAASSMIFDKFISCSMDSVFYDTFTFIDTAAVPGNVVGIKRGTNHPDSCYVIICGHFDATAGVAHQDSAPGADDDAGGVAAVLEAARIMKDYEFEHNIRFIAFSAEEFGCIGSMFYAWRASQRGDDIRAIYNFDMIGYVDALPETIEVCGDTFCEPLIDHFTACADTYTTLLTRKRLGIIVGDDNQFSSQGYQAVGIIEDHPNVNPYYHTPGDTIGAGFNNLILCSDVIRAGVAALASTSRPLGIIETDNLTLHSKYLTTIHPNPFCEKVDITFRMTKGADSNHKPEVNIEIYDVSGRLVKEFRHLMIQKFNHISWFGCDNSGNKLPGGIYFLQLKIEDYQESKKLLLIK